MAVAITHVYDDPADAEKVVKDLEAAGFADDQISFVGRPKDERGPGEEETIAAATGATLGGVAGAGTGLLAALGLLAIPGIGPLVAAGVLATTLAGAATGAIAGGLIGALVDYGVSDEQAQIYAETVQRGGVLISVRVDERRADEANDIMKQHGPVEIQERGAEYRQQGWKPGSDNHDKQSEIEEAEYRFPGP